MMSYQEPLYKREEDGDCPQKQFHQQNGHAGLFFDKFCNTWSVSGSEWKMEVDSKLEWINNFTERPVGTRQLLEESTKRLMRLIHKRRGRFKILKSEYRFVTGLGRSHPIENGFIWHPILGTPYLPGSSIKGLVRSWAKENEGLESGSHEEALLGSPKQAGGICFLDAIPTKSVKLKADVMTPHYANWDKDNPPGDWRSPTPIPFLTMEKQTPLLFGIVPHGAVEDDDLDKVMNWLQKALAQSGGGAKTAVGYGRFGYDKKETDEWHNRLDKERMQIEAQKSPEGNWRLKLASKSEKDILDLVRKYLKEDQKDYLDDDVERCAFVKVVLSDYKQFFHEWKSKKSYVRKRTGLGGPKLGERVDWLTKAASSCGLSIE